jgi:tRNA(adenine34) deaminase
MKRMVDDEVWMKLALEQARLAERRGEVPVGAVLVSDGQMIAASHNAPILEQDPTAHAEVRCLRAASRQLGNYRLPGTTLYVTLEPCAMCAGAIIHARIERVVFGARDEKAGAVESVYRLLDSNPRQHRPVWDGGVLADEASAMLSDFFRRRRNRTN